MNDLQIDCFLEVVKNMSFSATAREKYISQPSISKHISNLEKELGQPLFLRTAKNLTLTAAGKIFYEYFKNSKKQFETAKREADQMMSGIHGAVEMAILPRISTSPTLISILNESIKMYPNIDIHLSTASFREIAQRLEHREADIVLSLIDMFPPIKDAVIHKLIDIPRVIVYRKDLFPSGFEPTKASDFQNMTFLMADSSASPYIIPKNINYCQSYGFTPKIKAVPNSDSMVLGALNGDGVIIFHTWIDWNASPDIGIFPIQPPHTVILAWMKDNKQFAIDIIANGLLSAVMEGRLS